MMRFMIVVSLFGHAFIKPAMSDLVCRDVADSVFESCPQSRQQTTDRVAGLEEQVRQLQKIVTDGKFTDSRRRHSGIPADCGEIFTNGTTTSGVYIISPDGRCPFSVYCDMTDDGWTVIQRRIDGAVNFYRTWDEYVQGFGEVDGEYWLGLEKIHRLTKDGYETYFDIENYDGTRDHAHYKTFAVHGATTLYKLNVDAVGYKGTIAELLSYHNNQKFSTFDNENDEHATLNCASYFSGGGWWYKGCIRLANANSIYGKQSHDGISYHDNKNYVYIKKITLKVRAKDGFC